MIKDKSQHSFSDLRKTENAIRFIKNIFAKQLAKELNLMQVSAPLFVRPDNGINDDLNGTERPVSFHIKSDSDAKGVIVHSLAKWKRTALVRYGFKRGEGLYTDMKAIRADEELDKIHSLYVDQWDWELVINKEDRNLDFLKNIVKRIYFALKKTEQVFSETYSVQKNLLPEAIHFVHTEELENLYPNLTPKQREHEACKKYGAIFLIGIGGELKNGAPHDGRAPDYDDWSTLTQNGFKGLNGDILLWNPILQDSFEISSMGIRVDKDALVHQLKLRKCESRLNLKFHSMLINNELPLSIGGGIGQSRLCMFLLQKNHIGQVQASLWPESIVGECEKLSIALLG